VGSRKRLRRATRAAYPSLDPDVIDGFFDEVVACHPPGWGLVPEAIAGLDVAADPEVLDFALDVVAHVASLEAPHKARLGAYELLDAACRAAATTTDPAAATHGLARIHDERLTRCAGRGDVDRLVAALRAAQEG
jgi:hypothetical protein